MRVKEVGTTTLLDPQEFRGIISLLRFFVESRRLGIVDRVGLALSASAVKEAIYEALRTVRALQPRRATFTIEVREGKTLTVNCCDYDELEGPCPGGLCGKAVRVEGPPEARKLQGKNVWCALCPELPNEEELSKFFEALEDPVRGLHLARMVAALALGWRPPRPQGEENG